MPTFRAKYDFSEEKNLGSLAATATASTLILYSSYLGNYSPVKECYEINTKVYYAFKKVERMVDDISG